jgi:hypothetical protein
MPIRLRVRRNDNVEELASRFFYSCSRNQSNPQVSFLQISEQRETLLLKSLTYMMQQLKEHALRSMSL